MTQRYSALGHRLRSLLPGQGALSDSVRDGGVEAAPNEAVSADAPEPVGRRFLIVTPVFNAEAFIDEAVASVLRQGLPGSSIHYHVQDGGSTDGTLDKLRAWEHRLRNGLYVPHAGNIVFSFASERDGGMYDALQRGFARLAPRESDILTWINSDDGLAQGALVTVGAVFNEVAECEFLSGRTALLNEEGAVIVLAPALPFARRALANGLHDGRTLPFLMQEGTFFSGRVWKAIGGVDTTFRLAGDWDLWRRMARVAGHCSVDSITGFHRRRRGQLSADMKAYLREIDTAPPLPDATELTELGSVVAFDQTAARWSESAYDPSTLTAPALLRDGRPESSAVCRPVAGFAAPEGPYPQYQLPGGIRWMEGCNAEIVVLTPTGGRYRIRLTVRASRNGIVLGLGIGGRATQPITLEAPVSLVDQVIETVRWLDAGENRMFIDCNGSPDERSILLVRCEVTSTDEAFVRRHILAPLRPGIPDLSGLAIVILCADDEPDLLDLSLAGCSAIAGADTAMFVVRDPRNAALDAVLRARRNSISDCIDIEGAHVDIEATRQALHAAGYATVLVIQRGSVLTPRGVDAASTLLDATGAGAADGFVDTRDSTGRSLHLSLAPGTAPILYRATGVTDANLKVGCSLAQTVGRAIEVRESPTVCVLDGDRPMLGRTPAALLVAGLALLGYDVRHIVVGAAGVPALPPGAIIIASHGLPAPSGAMMTIGQAGGSLRLARHGDGSSLDLPFAVDTDLLLPRDRHEARQRLSFAADERIICIAEASEDATALAIARVTTMAGSVSRILNFGHVWADPAAGYPVLSLGAIADPLLLSYLLSAADAAVTLESGGSILAASAWSCGLTVLDQNGGVVRPDEALRDPDLAPCPLEYGVDDANRSRNLMLATRTIAVLANAIDEHCFDLRAIRGSSPLRLRSGSVPVRSYRDVDQLGWFDPITGAGIVDMTADAATFFAADGERGLSIHRNTAEIIVCLPHADIKGLRLHVRGTPGETWTVQAEGSAATVCIDESGVATATLVAAYRPGPTRVRFGRRGDDSTVPPPLHVVGMTATGPSVSRTPAWEETKFSLVPTTTWPTPTLEMDGDWQRLANFLPQEPAVPQEGLHAPFQWSFGDQCTIRVRVSVGGPRPLRLALSAGLREQRVRPVVAGRTYDWCAPFSGPIGHVERREWLVDWPIGDIDVTLELSDVLRAPGQQLGMILFAVIVAAPSG